MVRYSAYESDEDDNPIDNLDEVAIKGQAIIVLEADDFYGGKSSVEYRSPILRNPTWLDLALIANDAILAVNDHHHVFLEGVIKSKKRDKGIAIYHLSMGS